MTKKIALITGITGQDGSYLAEFLIQKGYQVHGIKRRVSTINTQRIDHIYQEPQFEKDLILHHGDMTDSSSLMRIISLVKPDEIYNLAAQSHVAVSFEEPEYTANSDALGALRILEAIRLLGLEGKTRYYQASTSELYGKVLEIPQKESTPFYPRSPYAVAKLYAYWITVNYREAYNIYAVNGILFNHESSRRGETFVTRKITRGLAAILFGKQKKLYLGNLDAKRDWGHAQDYVRAMWLMLQQEIPTDMVIATGTQYSVRDFIECALSEIGVTIQWVGKGIEEKAFIKMLDTDRLEELIGGRPFEALKIGDSLIEVDPRYFRPAEVETLLGDSTFARDSLGWSPSVTWRELVIEMIHSDIAAHRQIGPHLFY